MYVTYQKLTVRLLSGQKIPKTDGPKIIPTNTSAITDGSSHLLIKIEGRELRLTFNKTE